MNTMALPIRPGTAQNRAMRHLPRAAALALLGLGLGACQNDPAPTRSEGQPVAEAGVVEQVERGSAFSDPVEAGTPAPAPDPMGLPQTLDPSITAGRDPNLAQGLRQDPGQLVKGAIERLVTFGDLSLVGVDLDALFDYMYKPETELAKTFAFPDRAKDSAGEDKAVIGYMIALEMKPRTRDVLEFMLVKDLLACCYGGSPRPDEWILVRMKGGETCENILYRPVLVRGDLEVGRIEDEYGYAFGLYGLDADSVEQFVPSKYDAKKCARALRRRRASAGPGSRRARRRSVGRRRCGPPRRACADAGARASRAPRC